MLVEIPGTVEVKGGIHRNGKHVAGVDIHDDTAGAVFATRLNICLLDLLVKRVLHEYVNGSIERVARNGRHHALVIVGHLVTVRIACGHVFTIRALEVLLIGVFQAVNAGSVTVGKANGMCCQAAVRIIAGSGGFQVDHIL